MRNAFLALVLPVLVAAQQPSAPIIAVETPALTEPASQRILQTWTSEARCGSAPIAATTRRVPLASLIWGTASPVKPVTYLFDIDPTGRTIGIRRDGTDYIFSSDDLGPALAATRFAAGAPRSGCVMRFTAQRTPLTAAPINDLLDYSADQTSGPLPKEAQDRLRTPGTCLDAPRPAPLRQEYPDFTALPGEPGRRNWSMVTYDTDAAGRPRRVATAHSTGNAALDAAAVKAIAASRYTGGARTGCRYTYWRAPDKLIAPPIPVETTFRPADASCPERRDWVTQPVLRFPEAYRRRAIEGWAVVAYDIAPWGELGNIRVLAAQPSADFGTQAIQLLRAAKVAGGGQGAVGCIDRVKFVMGPVGGVDATESAAPPR